MERGADGRASAAVIRLLRLASLAFAGALLCGAQCGLSDRSANAPPAAIFHDSTVAIGLLNPCSFPAYSVPRLLGPLDGYMWLAKSMSDTTFVGKVVKPSAHWACMIRLAPRPGVPKGSIVAFEIRTDDAIAFETGAAEMNGAAKNMLDLIGAKTADGAQHGVHGWDYLGAYPREMTGRVGHIAIHVDWGGVAVSVDSIEKLMTLLRDGLPDAPVAAIGPGSMAGEEDPCSLVTRKEAESILGKLLTPPYESRDLSGLADSTGTGCSYYTTNHHVLSIRPWWSHGETVFKVSGARWAIPTPKTPIATAAGDLGHALQDAVGNYYFLKGDQMLAVSWKTSSTDENGALKIAAIAMKRLAK
jgi:hypothetical protein